MTLIQELGVAEEVLSDIGAFAAGKPVQADRVIAGTDYRVYIAMLPNGPSGGFVTIPNTGFFAIFEAALGIGAQFLGGLPVQVAVKEGNTWYGLDFQAKPAPAAAASGPAAISPATPSAT